MTLFIRTIFATVMLFAGFLLFQVQPMIAKYILPWFGGSATTWTVCMLFFQLALLIGYAYVYAVTVPLTIRNQAILLILLVTAAVLFLPITPSESMKPPNADNPVGRIMLLLTTSVGLPYVILSTTSPLLQRWLAHADKDILASRYFAFSNIGSLLGLLSYPFLFEWLWSSSEQTQWWSHAFIAYACLGAVAAGIVLVRISSTEKDEAHGRDAISQQGRSSSVGGWIFYSALGSVLLLATTNQISQWTAIVPFLWILPLSLYFATFIIAFGHQAHYDRMWFLGAFGILTVSTFALTKSDSSSSLLIQIGLQALTMFIGCMICHSEMVRLQPSSHRLPRFYMMMAFGGALGGVIVTLLAPLIFPDYFEHQIALALVGLIAIMLCLRYEKGTRRTVSVVFSSILIAGFAYGLVRLIRGESKIVDRIHNFYGVVKVVREADDDPVRAMLTMF